jgi:hypothetical protein
MADWNWLYSAFAQSAAAIVGFFGGFIINKVINRDAEYHSIEERSTMLFARIMDQSRKLEHRYFGWYNERTRENVGRSDEFEELVQKGSGTPDYSKLLPELKYSPFDSFTEIKRHIDENWGKGKAFDWVAPNMSNLYRALAEERELIDKEFISTEGLITDIRNHIGYIVAFPKGGRIIKFSLILVSLLFLIGVMFPLALSPSLNEWTWTQIGTSLPLTAHDLFSVKSVLIIAFALLFLSIVAVFWNIEARHFFSKATADELGRATKTAYYTKYFNFHYQV